MFSSSDVLSVEAATFTSSLLFDLLNVSAFMSFVDAMRNRVSMMDTFSFYDLSTMCIHLSFLHLNTINTP